MIKNEIQPGNLIPLKEKATHILIDAGFKPDYVEIADAEDLSSVDHWDGKQKMVALVAAYLNEVRLIDNMVLG
jgi:pantoate--beta-alanine ligase